MAKYITNEEFFNQLNSCEYGRQYIELVTNHKNHLGKKEEGEDHHMYMKAICGKNSHLVRLSYYNHCLAHLLLAKAGFKLDAWWSHKALCVINKMSGKAQYSNLTDLEKADLELEGWAEARKLSAIKMSEFQIERYKDPNEREKASKGQIERYKDPKERERMSKTMKETMNRPEVKEKVSKAMKETMNRPKVKEKVSKAAIERYKDPKEHEKSSKAQKERFKDPKEREKMSKAMIEAKNRPEVREKMSKAAKEALNRPEVKEKMSKSQKEVQNRPEIKAKTSAGQVGRKVINNGQEEKRVYVEELSYYFSIGWKLGQKHAHVKKSA